MDREIAEAHVDGYPRESLMLMGTPGSPSCWWVSQPPNNIKQCSSCLSRCETLSAHMIKLKRPSHSIDQASDSTSYCRSRDRAHQEGGGAETCRSRTTRLPALCARLATLTIRARASSSGTSRHVSRNGPKWFTRKCGSLPSGSSG